MITSRIVMLSAVFALMTLSFPVEGKPSLEELRSRVEKGNLNAAVSLGHRYRDGEDVERDYEEALKWYRYAADKGSARAMDNVGWMLRHGKGAEKNPQVAAAYFAASADGGHGEGAYNLGKCHFSGIGVEQNYDRAISAWKSAAELGYERAAWRLAVLYAAGEGIARDKEKAKEICTGLAEKGSARAMLLLGEILFEEGKVDRARKVWSRASEEGNKIAAALLEIAVWRNTPTSPGRHAYVDVGHLYQGWNNCGATSIAMFARALGCDTDPYAVKRLCPRSPIGTGTDWADLVEAGRKLNQDWQLVTFPHDEEGFRGGVEVIRQHLDAGRPVVIDFTYTREELGVVRHNGHTLLVVGYHADSDQFVLKNPNQPPPGIQLMNSEDLEANWYSRGYSRKAKGLASRPLILLSADLP